MTNISTAMNFRGLCMQHGYNSKRLAEEVGLSKRKSATGSGA